jgi:hypothetical protein
VTVGFSEETEMKKTLIAIVGAYIVQFGSSYLIHEIILKKSYRATDLFRSDEDMGHRLWIMLLAQLIFTVGAVLIYQRGVEKKSWVGQGIRFGILLAMVGMVSGAMINYVVIPMPHTLAFHQIIAMTIQCTLVSLVIAALSQPSTN